MVLDSEKEKCSGRLDELCEPETSGAEPKARVKFMENMEPNVDVTCSVLATISTAVLASNVRTPNDS